jgi:hypothetical protein
MSAAAEVLAYIAAELASAATALAAAIGNEDAAAAFVVVRTVEHAGAVADRAAAALGVARVQGDDEWRLSPRLRAALAELEHGRQP